MDCPLILVIRTSMKTKHPDFQGVSKQGKNGGTYLTDTSN